MKKYLTITTAIIFALNAQTFLFAKDNSKAESTEIAFEQLLNTKDLTALLSDSGAIALEKILLSPEERVYNDLMKFSSNKTKAASFKENMRQAKQRALEDKNYAQALTEAYYKIYTDIIANPSASADYALTPAELFNLMNQSAANIAGLLSKNPALKNKFTTNNKAQQLVFTLNSYVSNNYNIFAFGQTNIFKDTKALAAFKQSGLLEGCQAHPYIMPSEGSKEYFDCGTFDTKAVYNTRKGYILRPANMVFQRNDLFAKDIILGNIIDNNFLNILQKNIEALSQIKVSVENDPTIAKVNFKQTLETPLITLKQDTPWESGAIHNEMVIKLAALRVIEQELENSKNSYKYNLAVFDILSLFYTSEIQDNAMILAKFTSHQDRQDILKIIKVIPFKKGQLIERQESFIKNLEQISKNKTIKSEQNTSAKTAPAKNTEQKRGEDYKKPAPSPYESPYGSGSVR